MVPRCRCEPGRVEPLPGEESASGLSNSDGMAAAVLFPGGLFINKNKKRVIDINHYHVSLAHARSSVLKATAQQHGVQLVGELAPCSGCSMAKGIRASTPHRTISRAEAPLDLVQIDTAGPFPESLGGSRYVVMFVKAGSAVHKHNDVPRASQGFRERSRGVDVDQVEWSLCPGCGAVRCRRADALGHRTSRAWCQLPYKLDTVLLGSGFQYTRMGVGKGNVVVVNIYYSLFIFVDKQSTRGEHCRSHTITITQNRRRLFSLFPCHNNRIFHVHPCTRVAPPARTTRTQCFLCNGGSYTTVLYGGRGVCECRQRVTRACVCSLHYSSSTQGRSNPSAGEHETTIE